MIIDIIASGLSGVALWTLIGYVAIFILRSIDPHSCLSYRVPFQSLAWFFISGVIFHFSGGA